jgi:hypothetical protein
MHAAIVEAGGVPGGLEPAARTTHAAVAGGAQLVRRVKERGASGVRAAELAAALHRRLRAVREVRAAAAIWMHVVYLDATEHSLRALLWNRHLHLLLAVALITLLPPHTCTAAGT